MPHLAVHDGEQHLGFVNIVRRDVEKVFLQHDQVGLLANFQRTDLVVQTHAGSRAQSLGIYRHFQGNPCAVAAERGVMRIIAEIGEDAKIEDTKPLATVLVKTIKHELMVTPMVELVAYGTLPRSERKSQRVFDTRIQDSIL